MIGPLSLLMRLDVRRPASWIAAVAAFVATWGLLARPVPMWVAVTCGSLLALASLGFPAHRAAIPGLAVPRTLARVAWPVVGAVGAGLCGSSIGGRPQTTLLVVAAVLGMAAVQAVAAAARRRSTRWGLPGASSDAAAEGWIDAVAMASVLLAMAVCYFLSPHLAGWYAVVAGCWFVGLVVPRATPDGVDAGARQTLVATAPAVPRVPGTPGHAARVLATGAAILGWPAMVAGVLWSGSAWAVSGPAAAVALLTVLAGVSWLSVCAARDPGDTPQAVATCALATLLAWAAQAP